MPQLTGLIKAEIKSTITGTIGTTNSELLNPLGEGEYSFEPSSLEIGSGEKLNAGGVFKVSLSFTDCQATTGATLANLRSACLNNERVMLTLTYPNKTATIGGAAGLLFQFDEKVENKSKGAKRYTLSSEKFVATLSSILTEV